MVAKKKKEGVADPGPTSLFLFTPSSPVRRLTTWLISTPLFEGTIIVTIIVNCLSMALDHKLPNEDRTTLSNKLELLEPIFMVVFSVEMFTKILAQGFILHKNSYMRNFWNIMDFFVVSSGFLPLVMPAGSEEAINLNTLRTFRVLRPLKLVSGVPSLQVVMTSIGKAIGPLSNIALLLLFAVIIFAIIGLEFYSGALNRTCYDAADLSLIVADGDPFPCFPGHPDMAPMGSYTCNSNTSVCLEEWEGPNYGITSFDNIGLAMLTVFQCVSMEGWTPILYATDDAIGKAYNWMFFIPLIIIGSFFMLNLVLGVLSGEFAKEKDRVESRAGFLLLKEEQKLEREMNGYMNWICRAEDLVLAEDRTTEKDKKRIFEVRRVAAEGKRKVRTEEEELASYHSEWGAKIGRIRIRVRKMCKQQWWFWLVVTLVFLNTCTVAVEHYGQPFWLTNFLGYAEMFFLGAFIFEMLIRMYALGAYKYFGSAFNKFDTVVITGSVFEVFWVHFKPRANAFGLSGLRALRLLRVFKVTKYWSPLRNLVIALMNALSSIMSLLFLLFLFIFIFALLGMQLFGGSFNFPDETPTSNFDTVINALLTVFQVLTEEDWNHVMYTAIRSQGGRKDGGLPVAIYFVMLTLLGNYCLLNVFLAIACDSLDQAAELTAAEEAEKEKMAEEEDRQQQLDEEARKAAGNGNAINSELGELKEHKPEKAGDEEEGGEGGAAEEEGPRPILPYSSLFILSPTNPVRVGLHWFVTKPWFDGFIMFVILLSSVALAAEDPVQENHPRNKLLKIFDYGFTAIFAVECLLKILDLGVVFHPGAYLRDVWNVMDSLVVSCALVSFYFQGTPMGKKLKSVKLLRVLRPLKLVNRVPALKAVFDCVVTSLKNVMNILIVYLLFLLIFAMVGVQLFNGKFFYCTDDSAHTENECQGEFFVAGVNGEDRPTVEERLWEVKAFNYDNCGIAMITLFAVQTSEGWVDVLQTSMSSTYEDEGPIPWFRTDMAIFYIVYFVVFPFFFVNIFVALVIVTFNELGEAELTDDIDKNQKSCINFCIQAKPMEVYVPEETSGCLYHIWRLVTSPPFENFILFLIVLNTLLLMMKFHGAPLWYMDHLADCNLVFTILFTIECAMKLTSFGPKAYFKDSWNTFDFITVVGSIIDATGVLGNIGFLRLFRAARLIKLLRRSVSIRILLFTFVQSIKALPYVMMLMQMLFFIYAIVGMQLFGTLILDNHTAIERHNNFRNVFNAFLMLFRCSTGEAWPDIMMAANSGRPCDPLSHLYNSTTGEIIDPEKTCGNTPAAYGYFISFIFLCSFIMLNIVVAVIMDSFDYLTRDSSILGSHHLGEFISVWCEYDPLGEGKIHYMDMFALLKQIDPPLGFGSKCPDLLAYKRLVRMNMPVDVEGKVHFSSTLFSLVRVNLTIFMRSMDEMDQADQELRHTIGRIWPFTKRDGKLDLLVPPPPETGPNKLTVGKIFGGMLILENWKLTRFMPIPSKKGGATLPNGDAIINANKMTKTATSIAGSVVTSKDATPKKMMNGIAPTNLPGGPHMMMDPQKGTMGITGKAPAPPPKEGAAAANERVQNYINNLEPNGISKMGGTSSLGRGHHPSQIHGGPIMEPTYENFPSSMQKKRQRNLNAAGVSIGGTTKFNGTDAIDDPDHIYQNPARIRGSSVDRHREYLTPQYYEDTYYREDNERRITVKHIGLPGEPTLTSTSRTGFHREFEEPYASPTSAHSTLKRQQRGEHLGKLERQWSHPNLRPRPSSGAGGSVSAMSRRLPRTPTQPPGTIIVIENVLPANATAAATTVNQQQQTKQPQPLVKTGRILPGTKKQLPKPPLTAMLSGSTAAVERIGAVSGLGVRSASGIGAFTKVLVDNENRQKRACSLPRKNANQVREKPPGTGRRLPPTPKQVQGALPLQNAPVFQRKRELPKPQSLDLKYSNHEVMNVSNAAIGLIKSTTGSRSMNFPRLEGSPTHSDCSSGSPAFGSAYPGPSHMRSSSRRRASHHHHRRRHIDY